MREKAETGIGPLRHPRHRSPRSRLRSKEDQDSKWTTLRNPFNELW